ncbi:glycosyltransferase family protein [Methanobacterium sp. BAmetb5]|uniref:glycosyltransferase family protein n=1 Tax=Methanobacterium sp. BAmetb5 TaxID=2025351 RepID=UPI000E9BD360|nr:glycosyltransferase family protein [Methanobacterium sp. BAmetb5]AXV38919.1 MAG: hypothetical protein CIT02_00630 [Methanobacterium sp. BAmetb5]
MKRVIVIIQARMGSERLPGKVLEKIGGTSLLEIIINRVKRSKYINEVIVATTLNAEDDAIIELCNKIGSEVFRGSENDVFSRYLQASEIFNGDIIVRVTGDNPLTDPDLMDQMIHDHLMSGNDYTYSQNAPLGFGCEVISRKALEIINAEYLTNSEKEHVTLFIKNHPTDFKIRNFRYALEYPLNYRFTVDTPQDISFIKEIYDGLKDLIYLKNKDLFLFLEDNPEIIKINSNVEQQDLINNQI